MVSYRATRWRKKRRIPWALWGAAVAVAAVVLGGSVLVWRGCRQGADPATAEWGGMSKEEWLKQHKQRQEKEAKQEALEAQKETAAKKKQEGEAKRAAEEKKRAREAAQQTPKTQSEQPPDLPPVPQEFTQWKDLDYFVARLTGNPRLVLAVEYRSQHSPQNEEEATFFRKLLAPQFVAEVKALLGGRNSVPSAQRDAPTAVIGAITAALGKNGTPAARQTLVELLTGTLSTENDQVAVQAALKALADHPFRENDIALLAALTQPDKFRPPGQGQVTPEALQRQALIAIEQDGKSGVRLRAAERFVDPACPPELRKLLAPLWDKPHPDSLEAYALLCKSDCPAPQAKARIRKHLADSSSQALEHFLGVADGRTAPSLDPEWPYRVARLLWNVEFTSVFDVRRTAIDSMEEGRDLVLLAATVPRDDVRTCLVRVLERRWEEGPTALKSAGWTQTVLSEPGILAVLKTARRGRPVASQPNPKDRRDLKQQRKDPWVDAEETLVRRFCRRFFDAALSQARSQEMKPPPPVAPPNHDADPSPAVALHPRATVVAEYRVQWPGTHAGKLADIAPDPMDISYVRIEQKARPWSVRGHYERTIKGHKVHPVNDGIWIEAILPAAKDGRTRSIDVLVTRANAKADTPPDEPQELTIEILAVAIPSLAAEPAVNRRAAAEPNPDASP